MVAAPERGGTFLRHRRMMHDEAVVLETGEGDAAHQCASVQPRPGAPLEMAGTQLLLELLVRRSQTQRALTALASAPCGPRRQIAEVVFALVAGVPFAEQPDFLPRQMAVFGAGHAVAHTHAQRGGGDHRLWPCRRGPGRRTGVAVTAGQGGGTPAPQGRDTDADLLRDGFKRRALRWQQAGHHHVFKLLSVASHAVFQRPRDDKSYLGGNLFDTGGSGNACVLSIISLRPTIRPCRAHRPKNRSRPSAPQSSRRGISHPRSERSPSR